MRTFRQIAESDTHFASMPHEHLHAETHAIMSEHGGTLTKVGAMRKANGWHVEHPADDDDPEYEGDNEDPYEAHERGSDEIDTKLGHIGWNRDRRFDVGLQHVPHMDERERGNVGFTSEAYTHPNGSVLYAHHGTSESGESPIWTDYEMRRPDHDDPSRFPIP